MIAALSLAGLLAASLVPQTPARGVVVAAGGGSTVTEDNVGTPVSATAVSTITTISVTVGSGSNRLLLVTAASGGDDTNERHFISVSSSIDGALTFHNRIDEGVWVNNETWYKLNPTTGTHTITITVTSTTDQMCGQATSYTGVNQSAPFGTPAEASGTTGTSVSSGSVTYSTGGLIYGSASSDSQGQLDTAAGSTQRWQVLNVGSDTAYAGATRTTTGAITFTQSNNERYAVQAFLIQPAP